MKKPSVLIIATRHVGDLASGADVRLINHVKHLRAEYYVVLLHKHDSKPNPDRTSFDPTMYFDQVLEYAPRLLWDLGYRPIIRLAPHAFVRDEPGWRCAMRNVISDIRPDVIQCDLLGACRLLPKEFRSTAVAFGQDIFQRYALTRFQDVTIRMVDRLFSLINYAFYRAIEPSVYKTYNYALFVSQADARLSGNPSAITVPLGVETVDHTALGEKNVLCFTGNLSYPPNEDAIYRFIRGPWREIHRLRNETCLVIAGKNPSSRLQSAILGCPATRLIANPSDLRDIIRMSHICILPVFTGSGQKIKVLEALSVGRAVVTTPHAIEGTALIPGEHVLVARDNREIIDMVIRLLDDKNLCVSLGKRGWEFVRQYYSWEKSAQLLSQVYSRVLAESA